MSTIEKVQEEVLVEEQVEKNHEIVLYNDDVNTFDHVINCLVRICKHTSEQAEQCAIIVSCSMARATRSLRYEAP